MPDQEPNSVLALLFIVKTSKYKTYFVYKVIMEIHPIDLKHYFKFILRTIRR